MGREAVGAAIPPLGSPCPSPDKPGNPTCNLGCEGAARDVLVVVLDQDAVVTWQGGQIGHRARPIFVVNAADFGLGGPLNSQVEATCGWKEGERDFRERMFPCFNRDHTSSRAVPMPGTID